MLTQQQEFQKYLKLKERKIKEQDKMYFIRVIRER